MGLFKKHADFLEENAVNPDRRRYSVKDEAARHYIDIDVYGDSAIYTMPRNWYQAVEQYTEDTLKTYGTVPWHIHLMCIRLTKAFESQNLIDILKLSADLGHYVADAHVPLHTTVNYNGQLTGQRGIHSFWESRVPELLYEDFNFWVGKSQFIQNTQETAWDIVSVSHMAVDSVLEFERALSKQIPEQKQYTFIQKGASTVKVHSTRFTVEYDKMLDGQIEKRMRAAIRAVGSYWRTCWENAGSPDLTLLTQKALRENEKSAFLQKTLGWKRRILQSRFHESDNE